MKTIYMTEDGKKFESKEEAVKHEAETTSKVDEAKEALMKKIKENADFIDKTKEKIDALLNQIDKYADDIDKVYEKQDELLAEYREKYTTPEQKKFLETVDRFFDKLINYVE